MASFASAYTNENDTNWAQYFQDVPQFGYSTLQKQLISGQGKTPTVVGQTTPSTLADLYKDSPYANYFNGSGVAGLTAEQQYEMGTGEASLGTGLSSNMVNQNAARYKRVTAMPEKVSVQQLLQMFPQAQFMSPEVQQNFANNYRLGMASLLDPKNLSERLPFRDNAFQIRNGDNNESKYFSIQQGELAKLGFDPVKGFNVGTATLSQPQDNWIQKNLAPLAKAGLMAGVTAGLGTGISNTISGLGSSASGAASAGAGAGSATGSGVGTFGAAADAALGTGMITSPSGLAGLVGAAPIGSTIPAVAGGMLNPALAGGLAGATGAAASGGFDTSYLSNASSGGQQVMDAVPGSSDYGLNSLPNAGTMPNTATPALGAGAGEWTLPEALTNVPGATQAASGSTLGAGLALSPGSGLTTLGGGAAATSGMSSVTDFLTNLFDKGADKFMENPLQNTVGILSALSATSQGKDLADQLKALMNQGLSQSDPFGSQRAQYAAKLKQTYDDPNTYLGSDEYKGISRKRLEALERADAAQGRKSQYGARAEKMYEFDQENLNKERTMLAQLAGSGIQPGQVGNILSTLGAGSANAQVNANGQLYALLTSMFKGS